MTGVFLSYARFDSELGERIVAGLRALDVECWWDRDMPGVDWPREIERQIEAMSALVVIWTAASKDSKYVRAEAIPAFDREKLINIMFGVKEPPLPFNLYNGFQLDGWSGREPHDGWTRLVRTLETKLVKTGEVKQGQLVAALGRREQGVRRRQSSLADAEESFAAAKSADGEADIVLGEAKTALTRAEEQLSQVSAMHAGPNVIRGAQADLDEARTAVKDAETARRAAAAALATSSRALARAKTALESSFVSPPELASEPAPEPETAASAPEAGAVADVEPAPSFEAAPTQSVSTPQTISPPAPVEPARPASALAATALAGGGAGLASAGSANLGAAPAGASSIDPPESTPGPGPSSFIHTIPTTPTGAKRSSPLPLILGGGAVLVVGVLALAIFSGGHHPASPSAPADNVAANVAAADQPAPAPAIDAAVTAAQAMVGDWSGNGAVCGTNPLTVAFDAATKTVRETLSNTPSVGTVVGQRADGSVEVNFSGDGHTEYDTVSGDKLTLVFPSGAMTYQRCST